MVILARARTALLALFAFDPRNPGVRRVNVYLMRLVYGLMFLGLGSRVLEHIVSHRGPWDPDDAMSWSVWAACALLGGAGLLRPVALLPVLLFEVLYKLLWLGLVAYPLWRAGALWGSPAATETVSFLMVALPVLAIPWGHVARAYGPRFAPLRPAGRSGAEPARGASAEPRAPGAARGV